MTADQTSIGEKAAAELGLRVGAPLAAPIGERPLALAWRARRTEPGEAAENPTRALFVARPEAPGAERRRYVAAAERAERIAQAGEAQTGVLRVHAVAPAAEAFVTDLWTLGTARDLSALGWNAARRVEFVRGVAEGLERLHRAGIVHGCLCEENVLLDDDLKPVLAEAGAVSVHALSERGGDSASYVAFAAPEVLEGAEADARSDVFSLGRLLQHVLRSDDLPQAAEVIRRCVAPAPAGRYPSAAAVAAAVEALIASIGVEVRAVAPPPRLAAEAEKPAAAVVTSAVPSSRPLPTPSWLGPAGGGLIILALVISSLGIGGSNSTQTTLSVALVVGVGLAAMALRPSPRTPPSLKVGFALAAAALVAVADPLAYAYRSAAERAVRASPEARRAAVEQIVRLGRDFQNMSLAGTDLSGSDLRGADFRGADLSRADLSHVDLLGAMLAGASLAEATLAGTDLRQTDLARAHFVSAHCDARTMLPEPFHCASGVLNEEPLPPSRVSTDSSAQPAHAAPAVRGAELPAGASTPPSLEGGAPPR